MLSFVLLAALAQTQPAIRRTTPAADDPGMVVRQVGTVNVNCTSGCSGGGGGGTVTQGPGADAGVDWGVWVAGTTNAIPVTDNGGSLTVDGTVAVSGSVAVTGPLTDAQLRAAAVPVDGSGVTQPVSAASLPLPTGAATEATLSTRLADSTFTGRINTLGQKTMANSTPIAIASDQSSLPINDNGGSITVDGTVAVSGTVTVSGTVASTQSGTWSVRAQDGAGNALASSTSAPAGTEQALIVRNVPSGTQAVSGTVAATQSGTWNITNVSGTVSLPTGASTSALQTTGNTSLSNIDSDLDVTLSTRLAESTFTGRLPAGASLTDNFANPTTTQLGAMNMLWDGATWDRAPGNSTDGMLVNLGANNDVTVTGTVTANAGTGNFATNLAQYNGSTVGAANAVHVQPGTGASFTVAQATAANLRAQTASEGTNGSAIPTVGSALGLSDGTNLRIPRSFDGDTTGTYEPWVGVGIVAEGFGGAVRIASAANAGGLSGLATWKLAKFTTSVTSTAVTCATTATAAPASVLSNRYTLTLINNSSVVIYIGGSAVTTSNGIPLQPGASFTDDVEDSAYYCIVASGTADLRVLEN